jgi:hypothetical protein
MTMSQSRHEECYGVMFPSTLPVASDRPMRGKVFAYQLSTAGGTLRADRRVSADMNAWDACVECLDFDSCYKLSLAKLALETAISKK